MLLPSYFQVTSFLELGWHWWTTAYVRVIGQFPPPPSPTDNFPRLKLPLGQPDNSQTTRTISPTRTFPTRRISHRSESEVRNLSWHCLIAFPLVASTRLTVFFFVVSTFINSFKFVEFPQPYPPPFLYDPSTYICPINSTYSLHPHPVSFVTIATKRTKNRMFLLLALSLVFPSPD